MSAEPADLEASLPKKRKYTKRKPAEEAQGDEPILHSVPSEELPTHETPCCVITGSHMERAENEENVRRFDRCGKPSSWQPKIIFKGREMRLRKNEEGKPEQYRGSKVYTMPVLWQPVCDDCKEKIKRNPRTILSNEWVRNQTRSFIDMGFAPIEPEMTRMVWAPYQYEEPEQQSDVLDILSGIANQRSATVTEPFAGMSHEDAE